METDDECLIAADYCAEHGSCLAAELLRASIEEIDIDGIDWIELCKAVVLCKSWPRAQRKLISLWQPSTAIEDELASAYEHFQRLRDQHEELERAVQAQRLAQINDLNLANRLLWRRRGGYEEQGR